MVELSGVQRPLAGRALRRGITPLRPVRRRPGSRRSRAARSRAATRRSATVRSRIRSAEIAGSPRVTCTARPSSIEASTVATSPGSTALNSPAAWPARITSAIASRQRSSRRRRAAARAGIAQRPRPRAPSTACSRTRRPRLDQQPQPVARALERGQVPADRTVEAVLVDDQRVGQADRPWSRTSRGRREGWFRPARRRPRSVSRRARARRSPSAAAARICGLRMWSICGRGLKRRLSSKRA